MILAVAMLALAGFVALGPPALTAWARGRWLIATLAASAAAGAIYDALRGSWPGATILLAAAIWIAADTRRPAGRDRAGRDQAGMSRSEAASILGVGEGATRAEIEAAFRRLMQRVHPDHGGASGLAAQLNAARAVLLGRKAS